MGSVPVLGILQPQLIQNGKQISVFKALLSIHENAPACCIQLSTHPASPAATFPAPQAAQLPSYNLLGRDGDSGLAGGYVQLSLNT